MPLYKLTMMMQFNTAAPAVGFSESWTMQVGSDTGARNRMQTLIAQRTEVLSSSWTIIGGRIGRIEYRASPAPPRLITRLVQPLVCNAGLPGKLGESDTPWAAVLIEMNKAALDDTAVRTRPRAQQLRGIPDTWWTAAALSIPPADSAKLQSFFSFLLTAPPVGQFGAGQARIVAAEPYLQRFTGICLKRISNRRIGRPFGLIRGRKWARRA